MEINKINVMYERLAKITHDKHQWYLDQCHQAIKFLQNKIDRATEQASI